MARIATINNSFQRQYVGCYKLQQLYLRYLLLPVAAYGIWIQNESDRLARSI